MNEPVVNPKLQEDVNNYYTLYSIIQEQLSRLPNWNQECTCDSVELYMEIADDNDLYGKVCCQCGGSLGVSY